MPAPAKCVYPNCRNTRRTRGLCHGHYQAMRRYVREGKANEADLMSYRNMLLPTLNHPSPQYIWYRDTWFCACEDCTIEEHLTARPGHCMCIDCIPEAWDPIFDTGEVA